MDTKIKNYIGIGAQMGDMRSDQKVGPHLVILNQLLRKYCYYRYSTELNEFGIILRVDGDIWHWEAEGCEKLRLMRKQGYITIDIMMPRSRWEGKSALEIREFLITNLKEAFELIVKKLKKEHIEVNDKKLFNDFAKMEKEYLKMKDRKSE